MARAALGAWQASRLAQAHRAALELSGAALIFGAGATLRLCLAVSAAALRGRAAIRRGNLVAVEAAEHGKENERGEHASHVVHPSRLDGTAHVC
jgi:hypothetical protein